MPTGGVAPVVGTPAPTGEVLAETGAPGAVALPPTDAGSANTNTETWRLAVLLIGFGLAMLLVAAPKTNARRSR